MSDNCFKKNELLIPGTRHDERMPAALSPSYIKPDERSVADLLVFLSKYASLLNYYTLQGGNQQNYIIEGDWQDLIASDEAFNYAGIAVTKSKLPNITFYKYTNLYETGSTTSKRNEAYRVLWDILFSLYQDINTFLNAIPVHMPLRAVLHTEIGNNLISDFRQSAAAYLNAPAIIAVANLHTATPSAGEEYPFRFALNVLQGAFDAIWIDKAGYPAINSWDVYIQQLKTEQAQANTFFNAQLNDPQDKIDYATVQLKQVFKRAFEAYSRIVGTAAQYLQESLEQNHAHYAHHGLLLSFVQLFGLLQDDMNSFTQKHLEYYYNNVLQIQAAPAKPDAAHIVFEAAKNVSSHIIPAGALLNGGKDGKGKPLMFQTDQSLRIGQERIEQLKSVYLQPGGANTVKRYYAATVANSADGNGAAFTTADISWKAFGNTSGDAAVGFYIAAPVLHLTEGVRVIDFTFKTDDAGMLKALALDAAILMDHLKLSYSGEKQWEEISYNESGATDNCNLEYSANSANKTFRIRVQLPLHYKPMVGYDPAVCPGGLNTTYPVMQFLLVQGAANDAAFEKLRSIALSGITVTTSVSQMANFSLTNELGALDSSKPAQLFGPTPKIGSPFYIGHTELTHKILSAVSLTLKWLDQTNLVDYCKYKIPNTDANASSATKEINYLGIGNMGDFKVSLDLLRNKSWKALSSSTSLFDNDATTNISSSISGLSKALELPDNYKTSSNNFTAQSQNGFLRMVLTAPVAAFGHAKWPQLFTQQTIAYNSNSSTNSIPNPPYVPVLESMQLTYTASQDILPDGTGNKAPGQFFHKTPFGFDVAANTPTLLPDLQIDNKHLEAALYIGISNTLAAQQLSILLEVNEGSEDISVDAPEPYWFYLSPEGWKSLDKYLVADDTNKLLRSGIIKFTVPNDIHQQASSVSAGLSWIMAGIEENAAGLPRMTAAYTNAVRATFTDKDNDPERLGTALPAGSISRLAGADAAIKKISQPAASFGGRKTEAGAEFYTRSSERLRHKNRAITIWDHERLVLREFPEVYMTKCLNHTGYFMDCTLPDSDPEKIKYKENLPGHVMLVMVPFIKNLQAGNRFQPTLSASKLTDIKNFLHGLDNAGSCKPYVKALHCGHVALHVVNPQYETIEVQCKVKIRDCQDQLAGKSMLGTDLHRFLSPWTDGREALIRFGGKLHASQLVYFIEQLPYVDYLEDLKIIHRNGNIQLNTGDTSMAVAATSRSVLTSVGDDENGIPKHNISLA